MKNPLNRRIPRDLRDECGKYLVIFILIVASIGFVSGFLVADNSMIAAYNNSFAEYNIEDGNFRPAKALDDARRQQIEALGVKLYEMFYMDAEAQGDTVVRIFREREDVNRTCLMSGRMPEAAGEIALDRLYARNNGIAAGDSFAAGGREYRVTGTVALSDYSCLFQDNSDSMFDSIRFGTGIVTPETFDGLPEGRLLPVYSWKYGAPPASEAEEVKLADSLMRELVKIVKLKSFIPRYANQAIRFTGEDMGSDKAMMIVLLYIILVIMAFVFGLTTSGTIAKEATVIGTLRASGYTRGELIRHYMTAPMLVTLTAAVLGNVLGYTVFRVVCAGMYYNSYSLPVYRTLWNAEAFLETTVIPVSLMALITFLILCRALSLSPLKFIRRDLSRRKQKWAFPLPSAMPFFSRFRLRVFFQNLLNYLLLFVGILFANLLLFFGLGLPEVLRNYEEDLGHHMLSSVQTVLTMPLDTLSDNPLENILSLAQFAEGVKTEEESAEKMSIGSLTTTFPRCRSEEILIYGIEEDSRYVQADVAEGKIVISKAFADKYWLRPGDVVRLKEKYEDTAYDFTVDGIYNYVGNQAVFMSRSHFNELFGEAKDAFRGYFSEKPLTDIPEKYIASTIDIDDLTKISRQLDVSMGGMMQLVDGFSILIFLVLMYLLTKGIIEKNAQAISMAKILGYNNKEIGRLYLLPTALAVVVFLIITLPIELRAVTLLFHFMLLLEMTGWLPMVVWPVIYVKMLALGLGSFAVIAFLEYRKIRRIPMDQALKNVE